MVLKYIWVMTTIRKKHKNNTFKYSHLKRIIRQRGPHIERFQERPTGPGQIFLRAGGDYIVSTYDNQFSIIGEPDENPSDKIEYITRNKIVFAEETYFNKNAKTIIFADEFIALLANYDCAHSSGESEDCTPCVYPVVVGKCPKPCPYISSYDSLDRRLDE